MSSVQDSINRLISSAGGLANSITKMKDEKEPKAESPKMNKDGFKVHTAEDGTTFSLGKPFPSNPPKDTPNGPKTSPEARWQEKAKQQIIQKQAFQNFMGAVYEDNQGGEQ